MKGQETWKEKMAKVRISEAKKGAKKRRETAQYMKDHS